MGFNLNSDKAKAVARRRAKQVQQQKKKLAKQQKQRQLAQNKKVKRVQQRIATRKNSAQSSREPFRSTKKRRQDRFQFGILEIAVSAFLLLAIPVILFILWII